RPGQGAGRAVGRGPPLPRRTQGAAHGLELRGPHGRPRDLRRRAERGALLLRALVLPNHERDLACHRDVHLRGDVSRRGGARSALRPAVPPGEEPALGPAPAGELRGLRPRPARLEADPMAFAVIPAVDLKGGRCVRLLQGRADAETVFSDDPVAMARRWESEGAPRLHVVDLDAAFAARPPPPA